MSNYEENITINWKTSQAEEQARRLDQVLQTLNTSLGQIRESAQGAFSTIAGSLTGIASSVAALNVQLSETARLMTQVRGYGTGPITPEEASFAASIQARRRWHGTLKGTGGGPGAYTLGDIPVSHRYMGGDYGELATRRFEGPQGLLGPVGFPSEASALRSQTYQRVVENLGEFDRQVSETSLAFNNMGELSDRVTKRWFEQLQVTDMETGMAEWRRTGDIVTTRERVPTGLPGPADLSAAPIFNNINRELTEQAKAYNLGAQLDEGFAYVAKIEEEQRMQARMARYRQAQATLAAPDIGAAAREERQRAMEAAYEIPDPGGRFPLARQVYLQQQVAQAQANLAQVTRGFQAGRITDPREVEQAARAYQNLSRELNTAQNGVNLLSNMWVRHLFWIGQTIIILEGLRLVGGFISELAGDVSALADASARLNFLQPGANAQALLGGALTREGAYGVSPQNVIGGQVVAAQFRAPPGVTETAGQLALAFDAANQYDEILNEVIQTSIRGNGVMADQARILDLVAALYATAPGSLSEYMDAIQNAIPLSEQLGLSIETTAIMLQRVSAIMETTPTVTAGLLGKVVLRTSQPEVQRELQERFGIQPGAPAEMFAQIGQAIQQFDVQGNAAALTDLFVLISGGGGAQARQDIVRIGDAFREITPILQSNIQTTGQWATFFEQTTGTIASDIREMTSAAQAFIAVWANTGPVQNFFAWLGDQIGRVTAGLQAGAEQVQGKEALGQLSRAEQRQALEDFIKKTGGGTLGFLSGDEAGQNTLLSLINAPAYAASRVALMRQGAGLAPIGQANIQDDIEVFLQSFLQRSTAGRNLPDERRENIEELRQIRSQQQQFFFQPGGAAQPFGGLRELGGRDVAALRMATEFYEQEIRRQAEAAGIQYEAQQQMYLLWDEATNRFEPVLTTSDALGLAFKRLEQDTENLRKVFGGFRDLPEGMSFDQLQRSVTMWTQRIVGAQPGQQDYEEEREFLFWDEAANRFRSITAPVDALRYAIEENTKSLNRIQGVFNVPAEGEVLVPFTALQQGFVPSDRFEQMQGQGSLAQAGTALNTSADNLTGAATAITAAANRWAAGGAAGLVNQGVPPGVARQAFQGLPDRQASQMAFNRSLEQIASTRGSEVWQARMMRMANIEDRFRRFDTEVPAPAASAAPSQFNVSLNNRVTVAIDGRTIVNQLQREMYNRLVNAVRSTRSGRGGGGTSMAVM